MRSADRLNGFDKPTVWTVMTPLAIKTKSINLVTILLFRDKDFQHGLLHNFIQKILLKALKQVYLYVSLANHQYVRAFGSLTFTQAIAKFHAKTFKNLDIENDILVCNGGVEGLYSSITAFVNVGD